MDFETDITLGESTDDVEEDGIVVENKENDNEPNTGSSGRRRGKGWLFPILAVLIVAIICIVVVVRKRNDRRRITEV